MSNYNFNDCSAFKGIVAAVALSIPIWLVGISAYQTLNLPTVAVDIEGRCQWIEYSDGMKHVGCGDSLPRKYNRIIVGGYK